MRDNLFLICDSVSSILRKLKRSSAVSDLLVLFCLLAHHTPPSYDLMTFILCFYFIFFNQACLQPKLTDLTFFEH